MHIQEQKRRQRLGAAAVALLVVVFAVYVNQQGGWINTLNLPPTLDRSTPASQDGFALLSVQRRHACTDRFGRALQGYQYKDILEDGVQKGVIGLWIRPGYVPAPLADTPGNVGDSEGTTYKSSDMSSWDHHNRYPVMNSTYYQITARTSTGDTASLPWTIYGTGTSSGPLLLATLPGGYSGDCQFMDVTITDTQGHTARWRITDLPEMRHEITPPVAVTTSVTKSGITMTARAWREQAGQNQEIAYRLRPVLPPNSHQWDVAVTGQWLEWEPYDYEGNCTSLDSWPIQGRGGVFHTMPEEFQGGGIPEIEGYAPYQSASRYVRVSCVLRQYETYDETVTFHHLQIKPMDDGAPHPMAWCLSVAQEQTLVTPSGIPITLSVQDAKRRVNDFEGELAVTLLLDTKYSPEQVPRSPLVTAFHRPITVTVSFQSPFSENGQVLEPDPKHDYDLSPDIISVHSFKRAPLQAGRLSALTVVLHQRVDIQTIPMTFALPVADVPPPYYPPGFHFSRQSRHL